MRIFAPCATSIRACGHHSVNQIMPRHRKTNVQDKRCQSRVTTGKRLLPGIDGRSPTARRYRDLVSALAVDQGGADGMSEARAQLCRRFAAAACLAENMEADLVNGKQINIGEHCLLSSTLVRLASRIGINRHAREIVPSVAQYLENIEAQ
jgi:hypothetical protein